MNFQKSVFKILFLVVAFSLNGAIKAEHSTGTPGDPIRLLVAEARDDARIIVIRVKPENLDADADVKSWYSAHYNDYNQALSTFTPEWIDQATSACAYAHSDLKKIVFSYPTCSRSLSPDTESTDEKPIKGKTDAVKLLFHEAVHLLGEGNEDLADRVALAIYSTWLTLDINRTPRWDSLLPDNRPSERTAHASAYIKTKLFEGLFIWGGCNEEVPSGSQGLGFGCANFMGDGGLFNIKTNQWIKKIPLIPSSLIPRNIERVRAYATATFVPSDDESKFGKVLIFGGCSGEHFICETTYNSLLIYDLDQDSWSIVEGHQDRLAPTPRYKHTAALTTKGLLIYGGITEPRTVGRGRSLGDGWIFSITQNQWMQIAPDDHNAPSPRRFSVNLYTGNNNSDSSLNDKFIVYGGCDKELGELCEKYFADGAVYDIQNNRWFPLPNVSLSKRANAQGVWMNGAALIYGGRNSSNGMVDGAILNLNSEIKKSTWKIISDQSANPRYSHSMIWTGDRVLIWGGLSRYNEYSSSLSEFFLPSNAHPLGIWNTIPLTSSPVGRIEHSAVFTSKGLLIWGGQSLDRSYLNSGGLFLSKVLP